MIGKLDRPPRQSRLSQFYCISFSPCSRHNVVHWYILRYYTYVQYVHTMHVHIQYARCTAGTVKFFMYLGVGKLCQESAYFLVESFLEGEMMWRERREESGVDAKMRAPLLGRGKEKEKEMMMPFLTEIFWDFSPFHLSVNRQARMAYFYEERFRILRFLNIYPDRERMLVIRGFFPGGRDSFGQILD